MSLAIRGECLPGKVPLRDCAGCRWCGHCLLQDQAKFPYQNAILGSPAWWWAGYNSAEEARVGGWKSVDQDYQATGESAGKSQPTKSRPIGMKPALNPVKPRTLRGGIKLIS